MNIRRSLRIDRDPRVRTHARKPKILDHASTVSNKVFSSLAGGAADRVRTIISFEVVRWRGGVGEHVRRIGDAVTGLPADCE